MLKRVKFARRIAKVTAVQMLLHVLPSWYWCIAKFEHARALAVSSNNAQDEFKSLPPQRWTYAAACMVLNIKGNSIDSMCVNCRSYSPMKGQKWKLAVSAPLKKNLFLLERDFCAAEMFHSRCSSSSSSPWKGHMCLKITLEAMDGVSSQTSPQHHN